MNANALDPQIAPASIEDDACAVPHTFALTVAVPEDWIALVTQWDDLFRHDHCGYWARGVALDPELGWLVWVHDEKTRWGEEPDRVAALRAWGRRAPCKCGDARCVLCDDEGLAVDESLPLGMPLPTDWYRWDRALALRAFEEGVKGWGLRWYEDSDAPRYDQVVQRALFGREVYG